MWMNSFEWILHFSNLAVTLGVNLLVQSTILIAIGLIVAWLLRSKGAPLRSAILRMTLTAVVLCPVASLGLSAMGVRGFALRLPLAMMPHIETVSPLETPAETVPPEQSELPAFNGSHAQ